MAKSAADRAQENVDRLDEKIARTEEQKAKAVAKASERHDEKLAELRRDRDYAASHPALNPSEQQPVPTEPGREPVEDAGDGEG